ncbi:nucleoside-triphosphatase [Halobaculum sp. MBLA0147]|uniref:nucleoside-triphosphatase n=1 Tax=Halobaculum sp. MBLA0147 TaxID=3079934 RepID=UPI0035260F04
MPTNFLVTGPPRSGKTTVLQRVRERVTATAGGVLAPERRVDGERTGFDLVDVYTEDSVQMAHVDRESGPGVGKYRVDVPAVDRIASRAFSHAGVDYYLIDEIAPMEIHSDTFVRRVREVLDGDVPVVAAVHYRADTGFPAEVRNKSDATLFDLTDESVAAVTKDVVDSIATADSGGHE